MGKKILDKFSSIYSGSKRWNLRHPEEFKKIHREKSKKYRESKPRTSVLRILGYQFEKKRKLSKALRVIFKEQKVSDLDKIHTRRGKKGRFEG